MIDDLNFDVLKVEKIASGNIEITLSCSGEVPHGWKRIFENQWKLDLHSGMGESVFWNSYDNEITFFTLEKMWEETLTHFKNTVTRTSELHQEAVKRAVEDRKVAAERTKIKQKEEEDLVQKMKKYLK